MYVNVYVCIFVYVCQRSNRAPVRPCVVHSLVLFHCQSIPYPYICPSVGITFSTLRFKINYLSFTDISTIYS